MFYCIVTGSKDFDDYDLLKEKLDLILANKNEITIITTIPEGAALHASNYALERGYGLKVVDGIGMTKTARKYTSNRKMHEIASKSEERGCICFWNGKSKGTKNAIKLCDEFHTSLRIIKF